MLLELDGITVTYPNSAPVLNNISLKVKEKEFIGITGRSGSGKTTLLETIGGLCKPASGKILFRGNDIHQKGFDISSFRRKLQIVFQFPENQFFETDVRSEVAFGPKNLKMVRSEIDLLTDTALSLAGLDDPKIGSKSPFTLSGGQKRRLALACALAISPEILLLDEPFTGLDAEGYDLLKETLKKMNDSGMTILMVSHDPNILCEICDRLIVLSDGTPVMNSTPFAVYENKENCREYGIGRPDMFITAESIGIDLKNCYTYTNFTDDLKTLVREKRS